MSTYLQGFSADKPFIDMQHFPFGFARCGDFSLQQAQLLSQFGATLQDLDRGLYQPKTKEEKHFVAVCLGETKAQSLLERSWLKYKDIAFDNHHASAFAGLKDQDLVSDEQLKNLNHAQKKN